MGWKTIYQTLENRDNADEVERDGPFLCDRKNAWLGTGYYFWDTFVELAHWWGRQSYKGNYLVCRTSIEEGENRIFDLLGNTEHLKGFKACAHALQQKYGRPLTVSFVIEYIKRNTSFRFKAIRTYPIGSVKQDESIQSQRMPFLVGHSAYLDLVPAIQICVLDKRIIPAGSFKVVYPEKYVEGVV